MLIPAPFVSSPLKVIPDWIDENGHMNVAAYLKNFDNAFYDVYEFWGMDFCEVEEQKGFSTFVAETHLSYQSELLLNEVFTIESQLLGFDEKRIHWFQYLRKSNGQVAASCESLMLFVDLRQRRVVPIPADYSTRLAEIQSAHRQLPEPREAGRSISLHRSPK